jgi:DNA mismatch endonuclease (patch repair protein)
LFGNPDFLFYEEHVAVFVDGCFWHSCPVHGTQPANNAEFWRVKLSKNKMRDCIVNRKLKQCGWRIIRVWQHELLAAKEAKLAQRIKRALGRE